MPNQPTSLSPTSRSPGSGNPAQKVVVPGDLLSTTALDFTTAVIPRIQKLAPQTELVVDLRATRLIDSVGLNSLVSVIKHTKAREITLRFLVGNQSVRRILSFTRIDTHATVEGP